MTYATGGPIQANDYNTFATLSGSINEIFADSATRPNDTYGYGQTPALTSVSVGQTVTAAQWTALFQAMRDCGTHQGTPVVPPLPSSNPNIGDIITAYNVPAGAVSSLITLLHTNRFNLAPLQTSLITGSDFAQPAGAKPWRNTLTFNYQVNFGSWDNARYFFNTGGSLNLNGSYSPNSTPEDAQWISMFNAMSPLVFNYNSTVPQNGIGGSGLGFYNLSTSWQTIYYKANTGGAYYYTANSIRVRAKLAAAAGTNGLVDFDIQLVEGDVTPAPKNTTTTYRVDYRKSTGVITYPGSVTITSVGANNGFTAT